MSASSIVPPQGLAGLAAAVGVPWGGRSGSTDSAAAARRFTAAQSAERDGDAPALAAGGTWVQAAYMSGALPPPLPPPPPSMQAALQANPSLAARFGLLVGSSIQDGDVGSMAGLPSARVPPPFAPTPFAPQHAVGASQLEVEAMQRVVAAARQREGALGVTAPGAAAAGPRRTATPTTGRGAVRSVPIVESESERRLRLERRQALLNSHRDSGGVAREERMREQRIYSQRQSQQSGATTPRTSSAGPSSRRSSFSLGPNGPPSFAAPTAASRAAAADTTALMTRRALKGATPDVSAALRDGVPYRATPTYTDTGATYAPHASDIKGIAGDATFASHYTAATGVDATLATAQVAVRVPRLGPGSATPMASLGGLNMSAQARDPHGHASKSLYSHVPVASTIGAAAESAYAEGVGDMLRRLKDEYVGLRVHPEAALAYAPLFDAHTGRLVQVERTRTSPLRAEMRPGGAAAVGQPSPLQAIAGRGATFATAPMPPTSYSFASASAAVPPVPPPPPAPLPTLPRRGSSETRMSGVGGADYQPSARALELRAELEALERQWRDAVPAHPRETPVYSQSPEPRVGRDAVPIPVVHVDLTQPALPPPPAPLSTRDVVLQRLNANVGTSAAA